MCLDLSKWPPVTLSVGKSPVEPIYLLNLKLHSPYPYPALSLILRLVLVSHVTRPAIQPENSYIFYIHIYSEQFAHYTLPTLPHSFALL